MTPRKFSPILITIVLLLLLALPASAMASDVVCSDLLKKCPRKPDPICEKFRTAAKESYAACQMQYQIFLERFSSANSDCLQGLKETFLSCPGTAIQ